ncbi:hypothetical protein HZC53_04790 [Candidatus Uhrbacteria bacterium]|nr:hypothetical protein [Candidatus Uhrbacteria bacterium]
MNVSQQQLYFAGIFNSRLGCNGICRAVKIAELDDLKFGLLQSAFAELWPDAQEHSRLFVVNGKFVERVPYERIIPELLDEDWTEWRKLLAHLTEREWHDLRQALRLFREACRQAAA